MKEPILSREEVEALLYGCVTCTEDMNACVNLDWLQAFATAIVEKLCGEPIYQARQLSDETDRWDDVYAGTHSACASQPQFYETRVVYALTRSKA